MKFMILVEATRDSGAGKMRTENLFADASIERFRKIDIGQ